MYKEFLKDIKAIKRRSSVFFALVLVAFLSLLAVIFMLFGSISIYIIVPIAIFAMSVFFIVKMDKKSQKQIREGGEAYSFLLKKEYTYSDLVETLGRRNGLARSHTPSDAAVVFSYRGLPEFRISVIYLNYYDKAEYDVAHVSAVNEYNKKYELRRFVAPEKAAKMMYIDVVVADEMNEELKKRLSESANESLCDSPSKLFVAIVGNSLFVPRVDGELVPKDLSKYEKAVDYLVQIL